MKWIDSTRRKPKEGEQVLCYWSVDGLPGTFGVAVRYGDHWHEPEDDENDFREPEYWQKLPPAPNPLGLPVSES